MSKQIQPIPNLPDFKQKALRDPSTGKPLPNKIQAAAWDGYWQPGWEVLHYVLHTPTVNGWECLILWGPKGCLAAGSMVSTPAGPVPIEEVKVGDAVSGLSTSRTWEGINIHSDPNGIVTETFRNRKSLLRLQTSKATLSLSPEHRVLTPSGWREAKSLRAGELIIASNGCPTILLSIVKEAKDEKVYDLETSLGYYIANGLVVHNSYKSNREAWLAWVAYRNWSTVWKHFIMEPEEFSTLVREKGRIPVLVWDDIAAWLDSSMYFDNRDLYIKIKRYWQLLRTKISVFICSAPNKATIAGFILDDITSEIKCSPRAVYSYNRWAWQMNLKNPKKVNMFPVLIENRRKFDYLSLELPKTYNTEAERWEMNEDGPYLFPAKQWGVYWKKRIDLSNRSQKNLTAVLDEAFAEPPDYNEIVDSIEKYMKPEDYPDFMTACARILGSRGAKGSKVKVAEQLDIIKKLLHK